MQMSYRLSYMSSVTVTYFLATPPINFVVIDLLAKGVCDAK